MIREVRICCLLFGASSCFAQSSTSFTSIPVSSVSATTHSAQENERHLQTTPIGSFCANSAFAHGFRHGYDEGFHTGDFTLQLGRATDVVQPSKDYRQAMRAYRPSFGSKDSFQRGVEAGFRSGYNDAITGDEYRARERMNLAAEGLASDLLAPTRRAHFDEGVAGGYSSAHTKDAPKQRVTAEYVEQYCRKTSSGAYALEYCSGFSRGYLLGSFDAPPTETASSAASAH